MSHEGAIAEVVELTIDLNEATEPDAEDAAPAAPPRHTVIPSELWHWALQRLTEVDDLRERVGRAEALARSYEEQLRRAVSDARPRRDLRAVVVILAILLAVASAAAVWQAFV